MFFVCSRYIGMTIALLTLKLQERLEVRNIVWTPIAQIVAGTGILEKIRILILGE